MRLINADEIVYESIDSSDTEEYFAKHGTGIFAVRKEDIDAMPTVEPHWIPWTGECDLMDNEEVLVCQKDGQIRHAMFYDFGDKKKFVTWEEGITIYGVVAYMPLPEPYEEVTE